MVLHLIVTIIIIKDLHELRVYQLTSTYDRVRTDRDVRRAHTTARTIRCPDRHNSTDIRKRITAISNNINTA